MEIPNCQPTHMALRLQLTRPHKWPHKWPQHQPSSQSHLSSQLHTHLPWQTLKFYCAQVSALCQFLDSLPNPHTPHYTTQPSNYMLRITHHTWYRFKNMQKHNTVIDNTLHTTQQTLQINGYYCGVTYILQWYYLTCNTVLQGCYMGVLQGVTPSRKCCTGALVVAGQWGNQYADDTQTRRTLKTTPVSDFRDFVGYFETNIHIK